MRYGFVDEALKGEVGSEIKPSIVETFISYVTTGVSVLYLSLSYGADQISFIPSPSFVTLKSVIASGMFESGVSGSW